MDILNLFGFIENLALYFPKTKTIAISFLSGSYFAHARNHFNIVLKIQCGVHHLQ